MTMAKSLNTAISQSIKLDIPGEEYFLTTFEVHDIEALQETLAFDAVSDRLLTTPKPYTLENAQFWVSACIATRKELLPIPTVAERKEAFFSQTNAIPLKVIRHNNKLVGCISLTPRPADNLLEMGYYLHPAHHGKRIMTEAGRKMLRYAANEFGVTQVYSSADDANPASAKTIEAISKDTAVGEVEKGRKILVWPKGKWTEGESWSSTWVWNIGSDEDYEFC